MIIMICFERMIKTSFVILLLLFQPVVAFMHFMDYMNFFINILCFFVPFLNICTISLSCQSNNDCNANQLCNKLTCDATNGECIVWTLTCPLNYVPVCGCDGITYGNDCMRRNAKVSKDYDGVCIDACESDTDCIEEFFCEQPIGICSSTDAINGNCVIIPDACDDVYEPVCGCDLITYGNDCERQVAQVSKKADGQCITSNSNTCGDNIDCNDDNQFCDPLAGTCQTGDNIINEGICVLIGEGCPKNYVPVCGCNGITYSNDCMRQNAQIAKAYDGVCNTEDNICGGIAGIPCKDNEFCDLQQGTCNGADFQGKCVPIGDECITVYDPVCGCDGNTYSNDCERIRAGVMKDINGECPTVCGSTIPCKTSNEFCDPTAGTCDESDGEGTCVPIGDGCPEIFAPVCGCDGVTYSNDCVRQNARVAKDVDGACFCGGIAGFPCQDDEFCDFTPGMCFVADVQGVCVPIPIGCPDVWDPVCGCDGVTYSNDCDRQDARVAKDKDGPCYEVCGGIAGIPCEDGEYCDLPPGTCNGADFQGECVPIGDECITVYDPVCGCDGNTYSNDCERIRAGVIKDFDGECSTYCGPTLPCKTSNEFCDPPAGTCDESDLEGSCVPIANGCPEIFAPVCGCDGITYSNDCERQTSRVAKDVDGPCPKVCGGIAGIPCQDGEFCDYTPGMCFVADVQGVCVPIPIGCPDVWDPVCGCDGVTYSNDCDRQDARVAKDKDGPCHEVCGGIAGIPCEDSEFCDLPPGMCNGADFQGECVPIADGCITIYDPVCGCDGKTYSNDCERIRAGVTKRSDGECSIVCGPTMPCETSDDFCDPPAGTCNESDFEGKCIPNVDGCPEIFAPVCGCDGITYSNDCERQNARVGKDVDGSCFCGGIAGFPCRDGEFCDPPPSMCHVTDVQGECVQVKIECNRMYYPVCGCDGNTYSNDCERILAGVAKDTDGECLAVCGPTTSCENRSDFCDPPAGTCDQSDLEGKCIPTGIGCTDIWDPVCGCDGITYSNDCDRQVARVAKDKDGPCFVVCGGITGITCQDGEFCDPPPGICLGADLQGECVPIGDNCFTVYDPVCGCDGITYSNDCERIRAEVAKDIDGECSTVCGPTRSCETSDDFCDPPTGTCDESDLDGTCIPIVEGCPEIYAPVCGCDGVTYSNDCERQNARIGKDVDGPCFCGGIAGFSCQEGEFCDLPQGTCNSADLQGECIPIPMYCPENWDPVCGCDGLTYSNDCERQMAFVAKDKDGTCLEVCGGIAGTPCQDGELCDFAPGMCFGADVQGVCVPIPIECPDNWDPVCGCDGVTYGNDCDRQDAGVAKDKDGPCHDVCGGIAGIPCQDGEFCDLPPGTCNGADFQGECILIGDSCIDIYDPVCGCDGKTYDNDCERIRAYVAKDKNGMC